MKNRQTDLLAPPRDESLDALRREMLEDPGIAGGELAGGATQLVWGDGSPEALVMFIGEAPGASEDRLGRPFVGQAGKLLESCLESIGLKRERDIWISNLVKHRPPANRDPSPAEKSLYSPYLDREIAIIEPQFIVPLGRHAARHFLPNCYMGQQHGRPSRLKRPFGPKQLELDIIPFYHPAAALYNPPLLPVIREDFLALGRLLK